ncbi:MAG: hypothetical protein JNM39_10730 [Bdellovibrionaceae bacterium]|nr:hypothetical protein [Pseudobdellovibrionaceae bacterium]
MGISILSLASRLNTGSDLWVMPPVAISQQTLQIDWYLNFQISQSQFRKRVQRPSELQKVLDEVEWPLENMTHYKPGAFLVSANNSLPCREIVVLDYSEDLSLWTKDLFYIWKNLSEPSLRVFLPPKVSANDWFSMWRSLSSFEDMTVVLDS